MGLSLRLLSVAAVELVAVGVTALVDPQFLAAHAWWFIGTGLALLLVAVFWNNFKIVRRNVLPADTAANSEPSAPPQTSKWGAYEAEWEWLRAKDEGRAEAVRDTPLPEALAYIATGRWGERFFLAVAHGDDDQASDAPSQVRQRAHDGDIRIWGKRSHSGIYEVIPSNFWIDHGIEWVELLRGQSKTERKTLGRPTEIYTDLMVSRIEIERIWPWTATSVSTSC